ncbi:hypothetical protein [Flavobacterium okayamense]|uniref:Uncharacterized protein n=1 Tax=Flavobacterium okayamense TaxID=2830782 RepID=A0ABN6HV67_9FLAO|nr:hypothetical protein [Flavobacterium okayamense]BCY28369.1 hypothetical protein KK2020170_12370 [Flavobacterium okayamense]
MKFTEIEISSIKNKFPLIFNVLNIYYESNNGIDLINDKIEKNILNLENFNKIWKNDCFDKIEDLLKLKVINATHGLVPNVGGKIILKNTIEESFELHFFYSLLDNFYSIQIVKIGKINVYHPYLNIFKKGIGIKEIIVSPHENEFIDIFNKVDLFLKNKFKDSYFVPFYFDLLRIKDFKVFYKDEINFSTISDCFFHKGFVFDFECKIIGDFNYKKNLLLSS